MKHSRNPWKKTGVCFVCGKSTKLLVHQECGKAMDAAKKGNKVAFDKIDQQQHETARHNVAKKQYAAGYVPKFCRD